MPHIEIHGLDHQGSNYDARQINKLQAQIWDVLKGASYIEQVTIGYGNTTVFNHEHRPVRFLRIWLSMGKAQAEIAKDLIPRLAPLDMRVQVAALDTEIAPDAESRQGDLPLEPWTDPPPFPPGWEAPLPPPG